MESIASSYIKGKKWFRKTIDSRGKQVPQLDTFVQHDTFLQTFHSINEETGEIEKKNIRIYNIYFTFELYILCYACSKNCFSKRNSSSIFIPFNDDIEDKMSNIFCLFTQAIVVPGAEQCE